MRQNMPAPYQTPFRLSCSGQEKTVGDWTSIHVIKVWQKARCSSYIQESKCGMIALKPVELLLTHSWTEKNILPPKPETFFFCSDTQPSNLRTFNIFLLTSFWFQCISYLKWITQYVRSDLQGWSGFFLSLRKKYYWTTRLRKQNVLKHLTLRILW